MHDLYTTVLMREHGVGGIRIFDADFRRFEFLTVVDPLSKPRIRSWVRLAAIVVRFAGRTPAFLDAGLRCWSRRAENFDALARIFVSGIKWAARALDRGLGITSLVLDLDQKYGLRQTRFVRPE